MFYTAQNFSCACILSQSLSDLQTIYWRKVVHLPSLSSHWPPQWGLNNFVWSTCKSPCLLLLLEIDLSLWRNVWSLVEEFNPGSEKVWPAMTMLPHLTAQTQLQQQKSITKLICVKNLNLKRQKVLLHFLWPPQKFGSFYEQNIWLAACLKVAAWHPQRDSTRFANDFQKWSQKIRHRYV